MHLLEIVQVVLYLHNNNLIYDEAVLMQKTDDHELVLDFWEIVRDIHAHLNADLAVL